MPKYLLEVSYTLDGVRGLLKDGGSRRRDVATKLVESLGGRVESFYFVFGKEDVVVVADLPDNASAAAASLRVAASGAMASQIRVLITPEEVDEAAKKQTTYTPPGS